jgi:2-oxoglutarate dehydrogenase E1 component
LVFCTGKFYYDLLERKEAENREDVALVRIEQLFPLPIEQIKKVMVKYQHADDVVWAQEEPRNMGAYGHLLLHFEESKNFRVCSRKFYGSPAAGSSVRFKKRHEKVIDAVFDKTSDGPI